MRRPVTIHAIDPARGELAVHLAPGDPATPWLSRARAGDLVEMVGPAGRPIRLDARTRHLLLVAEGDAVAMLRPVADAALAAGQTVAVLLGAPTATEVHPSSLLADEVEYVVATEDGSLGVAGSVLDVVAEYEAWADQAVAAGSSTMLAALVRFIAGRDARLGVARLGRRTGRARGGARPGRRSWLQVMLPQLVGCALGVCLGCVVRGAGEPVRVCREGPSFDSDALTWEEPA